MKEKLYNFDVVSIFQELHTDRLSSGNGNDFFLPTAHESLIDKDMIRNVLNSSYITEKVEKSL